MINLGITDSELNFNWRRFCKTVSKSANWGFDRFRIYGNSWSTRIQVRRPDGSVVDTQYFNSNYQFEHDFSFDLSENVNNEEYSVYIAGVPASAKISQVYAFPTGYGGTTGKNAEITYWDLAQVSPGPDGTSQIGRLRLENNPVTQIDGASNIMAGEIRFNNCQLGAENLADLLIGSDNYGNTNGTFVYSGNLAAPAERALPAYNNLKNNKAWAITGEVPVNSPAYEAETTSYMNTIAIGDDNNPTVYTGITGSQLWSLVDDYVKGLKTDGLWNKIIADFPIIGGTSVKHTFNIKDVNQFQLTLLGSWVHDSSGMLGNGSNTYARTGIIPSLVFTGNLGGLTATIGTNNILVANDPVEVGSFIDTQKAFSLTTTQDNISGRGYGDTLSTPTTTAIGVATTNKTDVNSLSFYKNGVELLTGMSIGTVPDIEIYIGTLNLAGSPYSSGYSAQRTQGSTIHQELTDAEVTNLHNRISILELALGRKTW